MDQPDPASPHPPPSAHARALLRLSLVKGLGPFRIRALLRLAGGSAEAALRLSPAQIARVPGIGQGSAATIAGAIPATEQAADEELRAAQAVGARVVAWGEPDFPTLLAPLDDAPILLYVRGDWSHDLLRYPAAIVGSRSCTVYGTEQARRFAYALAQAGLTIVSGGALGIDTAAHQAALDAGGRTIAVLGSGLGDPYPPSNRALFDRIVASGGAVVSELPVRTPPAPQNFPARNRIISGLSLGVLVVEAGRKSGALITARLAAEDHGREVMAIPGRVDSDFIAGSLDLLKQGGAHLVTQPQDVLHILESAARHAHADTHASRFTPPPRPAQNLQPDTTAGAPEGLWTSPAAGASPAPRAASSQPADPVLAALRDEPLTIDQLAERLDRDIGALRVELTMLEVAGRITRRGSLFALTQ